MYATNYYKIGIVFTALSFLIMLLTPKGSSLLPLATGTIAMTFLALWYIKNR